MRFAAVGVLVFALVGLTTSSVLPTRELSHHQAPDVEAWSNERDIIIHSGPSTSQLHRRMDIVHPGDTLPGRVGFTFSLAKFACFVGSLVETRSEATTALLDLYRSAMHQIASFPPDAVFDKAIFLSSDFLTLFIDRKTGDDAITVDLIRSFLAYMIAKLTYGGYTGIYVAYLRQVRGPGMFIVKLQSNAYWLSQGVGGLPGTVGLAALGF